MVSLMSALGVVVSLLSVWLVNSPDNGLEPQYRITYSAVPFSSSITVSGIVMRSEDGTEERVDFRAPEHFHEALQTIVVASDALVVGPHATTATILIQHQVTRTPSSDPAVTAVCKKQFAAGVNLPTLFYVANVYDARTGEQLDQVYSIVWHAKTMDDNPAGSVVRLTTIDLTRYRGREITIRHFSDFMAPVQRPIVEPKTLIERLAGVDGLRLK